MVEDPSFNMVFLADGTFVDSDGDWGTYAIVGSIVTIRYDFEEEDHINAQFRIVDGYTLQEVDFGYTFICEGGAGFPGITTADPAPQPSPDIAPLVTGEYYYRFGDEYDMGMIFYSDGTSYSTFGDEWEYYVDGDMIYLYVLSGEAVELRIESEEVLIHVDENEEYRRIFGHTHLWADANYQMPSHCIGCGERHGDPLQPNFELYWYEINTSIGRPYRYVTETQQPGTWTVGEATLLFVDVFSYGEGYPEVDGYEWIVTHLHITYDDENARRHGYMQVIGTIDYYSVDPTRRITEMSDLPESGIIHGLLTSSTLINYYGTDFEWYIGRHQLQNEWINSRAHVLYEYILLVPQNYDGLILYLADFFNYEPDINVGDLFDSDTLFFRLRG